MRRRNDYAKCLAKVLELSVLMNTPIKEGGAKKEKRKDPSIPIFVHIGIRGYNLLNIKHIKYLTSTKTLICTFDGDSFEEKIPFEEALEILKKGGELL
jgi:hypothetical protein